MSRQEWVPSVFSARATFGWSYSPRCGSHSVLRFAWQRVGSVSPVPSALFGDPWHTVLDVGVEQTQNNSLAKSEVNLSDVALLDMAHSIYHHADINGDGVVDKQEFRAIFRRFKIQLSDVQIDKMMDVADVNKDNVFEFEEISDHLVMAIKEALQARMAATIDESTTLHGHAAHPDDHWLGVGPPQH